jgi:hypothetical protein
VSPLSDPVSVDVDEPSVEWRLSAFEVEPLSAEESLPGMLDETVEPLVPEEPADGSS